MSLFTAAYGSTLFVCLDFSDRFVVQRPACVKLTELAANGRRQPHDPEAVQLSLIEHHETR
jgi:hypothetical protein